MVSYSDVLASNESLAAASGGSGPVAVVVGGTNGIGLTTVQALLKHTAKPTIYLVGRSADQLAKLIDETLQPLNKAAELIPIVAGDLTLVRNAQRAADEIVRRITSKSTPGSGSGSNSASASSPHIDLLIMTPGYLNMSSQPDWSPEGLERLMAIRFHARMAILMKLLPLLRRAPSPRVVTLLAGGQEGELKLDDLGMTATKPKTYGPLYAMGAAASMTSLFLEKLATADQEQNSNIVFIHAFPGLTPDTGLQIHKSVLFNFIYSVVKVLAGWFGKTHTAQEAGERTLFAATSGRFRRLQPRDADAAVGTLLQPGSDGGLASGVFLVGEDSDAVPDGGNAELKKLRARDAASRVYDYTLAELERIEKS
ncbi:hypothetical protein A1O3_06720 [Capronia epimyces CBS 606.96]|uniref:Ketoreductase (KR) domain-containing protein n=1 Tax=Capronia epimyces CBS 606.96 TaxID=1182542 RepID=W9YKX1_9EURO|nr:uncharacterized protein A1O3_06720 [Capronia epimyces CBS 606.96]EXJ82904.1 hypothetical protein A1O3_06720 [Capronia epimyces CBS 606.96]